MAVGIGPFSWLSESRLFHVYALWNTVNIHKQSIMPLILILFSKAKGVLTDLANYQDLQWMME